MKNHDYLLWHRPSIGQEARTGAPGYHKRNVRQYKSRSALKIPWKHLFWTLLVKFTGLHKQSTNKAPLRQKPFTSIAGPRPAWPGPPSPTCKTPTALPRRRSRPRPRAVTPSPGKTRAVGWARRRRPLPRCSVLSEGPAAAAPPTSLEGTCHHRGTETAASPASGPAGPPRRHRDRSSAEQRRRAPEPGSGSRGQGGPARTALPTARFGLRSQLASSRSKKSAGAAAPGQAGAEKSPPRPRLGLSGEASSPRTPGGRPPRGKNRPPDVAGRRLRQWRHRARTASVREWAGASAGSGSLSRLLLTSRAQRAVLQPAGGQTNEQWRLVWSSTGHAQRSPTCQALGGRPDCDGARLLPEYACATCPTALCCPRSSMPHAQYRAPPRCCAAWVSAGCRCGVSVAGKVTGRFRHPFPVLTTGLSSCR